MRKFSIAFINSGFTGKLVGGIMILFCIILLCAVITVAALVIVSPGKIEPVCDENGNVIEGSIAEKVHTEINGTDMGMIIKSKDISNPVLLFIHGGPGMPEYFLTEDYKTGLEENFTVVWWDQRGSGLSYKSDIDEDKMTKDQFVSDTIEVTKYLCRRFGKDKIYLMAHSWGSYIGILAAQKAPELYNAYIGIGQICNQIEFEELAYDYMLDYYEKSGDVKLVEKLKKLNFKGKGEKPDEYNKIRDSIMHKAGIGTMRNMKSVVWGIFMPVMESREYTVEEKINIWRGKIFSASTSLRKERNKRDLRDYVTEFEIPVYFFSGLYDYTVNYSLSEDYLKKINAPVKGFYLFEDSAHSPIFEEPEKVMDIVMKDVINGRNDMADTK